MASIDTETVPLNAPGVCPECQEDDTCNEQQKAKLYASQSKLDRHLKSGFHSPHSTWTRMIVAELAEAPSGEIECPYQDGCTLKFQSAAGLYQHLEANFEEGEQNPHYAGLKAIGFLEPSWDAAHSTEGGKHYQEGSRAMETAPSTQEWPTIKQLTTATPARIPADTEPGALTVGPSAARPMQLAPEPPSIAALPRLTTSAYRQQCESAGMVGTTIGYYDQPLPSDVPTALNTTWEDLCNNIPSATKKFLAEMGDKDEDEVGKTRHFRAPDLD